MRICHAITLIVLYVPLALLQSTATDNGVRGGWLCTALWCSSVSVAVTSKSACLQHLSVSCSGPCAGILTQEKVIAGEWRNLTSEALEPLKDLPNAVNSVIAAKQVQATQGAGCCSP